MFSRASATALLTLALAVVPSMVEAQTSSRRENGVTRAARARAERASATSSGSAGRVAPAAAKSSQTASTATAPATPSAASAPAAAPGTFDAFMRAMKDLPGLSNKFVRIPALRAEQITLIDVRNVFRAEQEQERFETALAEQERKITTMRSTLQGSTTLRDLLYERQLSMSQVVAVDVLPDGRGTVVYYRAE